MSHIYYISSYNHSQYFSVCLLILDPPCLVFISSRALTTVPVIFVYFYFFKLIYQAPDSFKNYQEIINILTLWLLLYCLDIINVGGLFMVTDEEEEDNAFGFKFFSLVEVLGAVIVFHAVHY